MNESESTSAFELLHPLVKRQLWDMRWESLRPLQVAGINAILRGNGHVILSAPTAAGKTEAAFLPILSAIADDFSGSVRALYVGPLKALINDQFSRLNDLCTHLEIPVHHWHGDVAANKKSKLVADPGGVLLITPESIESLFINRPSHLTKLFSGLRFIVIDELHSFLNNERGLHLKSLLCRLQTKLLQPEELRIIGLSATLGSMDAAKSYISPDDLSCVNVIKDPGDGKELRLRLYTYIDKRIENDNPDSLEMSPTGLQLAKDIVQHCRGAANLVFANSRADVEELGDACARVAAELQLPDRFLVHHGSLAASIRQEAEEVMKSGQIATTFCSSTLELGVDIGSVKMVGQIDPPWSISSIKQRLGRSGRRAGEKQILRQYVRLEEPGPKADMFDHLQLNLVHAIAVTELLLSGWIEPPVPPKCDLSTLTHQIMSVIGENGGARADRLYDQLCKRGPFRDVESKLFAHLLRQLASREIIEQMPEGDLILGVKGERILRNFTFYAVFQTPDTFTVLHEGEILGELDIAPEIGQFILFAGRRWEVRDIDHENRYVMVVPARGRRRPKFSGTGGLLDGQIVAKMQEILDGTQVPIYLDDTSRDVLANSRRIAAETRICSKPILELGPTRTAIMTWAGQRVNITFMAMLKVLGIQSVDERIGISVSLNKEELIQAILKLATMTFDPAELAALERRQFSQRKYAWALGSELEATFLSRSELAFSATLDVVRSLAGVLAKRTL